MRKTLVDLNPTSRQIEIIRVLNANNGCKSKTALELGVSRTYVRLVETAVRTKLAERNSGQRAKG